MVRILLLSLLFIGLYRFITRIVLPVLRVTRTVRGQMRNMQRQTEAAQHTDTRPENRPRKSRPVGDYIEFEELSK